MSLESLVSQENVIQDKKEKRKKEEREREGDGVECIARAVVCHQ